MDHPDLNASNLIGNSIDTQWDNAGHFSYSTNSTLQLTVKPVQKGHSQKD